MKLPKQLALEYWEEFQPAKYQKYKQEGRLEKEASIIQAKVNERLVLLTDKGGRNMSYPEAQHQIYRELIYTEPEQSVKQMWEDEEEQAEREE